MLRNNPVKLVYCHTCKSSSMIDTNDLFCPKCRSDFLEEGNMRESGLELSPRLQDSSFSSVDSDNPASLPEVPEQQPFATRFMSFYNFLRRANPLNPQERIIHLRGIEDNEDDIMGGLFYMRARRNHRPMESEDIEEVERIEIGPEMTETDCKICGEVFALAEVAMALGCSHVFHEGCLVPWLRIKNSCPCCRDIVD